MYTTQESKVPTKNVDQCAIEGDLGKCAYAIGYGRPPLHSRFKN